MTNMTSVVCGDVFYYCAHSPRGIILYYCFIEERCTQIERVIYGPLTKLLHNTAVACVFVCLFIQFSRQQPPKQRGTQFAPITPTCIILYIQLYIWLLQQQSTNQPTSQQPKPTGNQTIQLPTNTAKPTGQLTNNSLWKVFNLGHFWM